MPQWVLLVGAIVCITTLALLVQPRLAAALMRRALTGPWRYAIALLLLLAGAALLAGAGAIADSRLIAAAGWLLALSALILVVLSGPLCRRLAGRLSRLAPWQWRFAILPPLLFGGFLLAAVWP